MSWFVANNHCKGKGGKLVEIDSEEEQVALNQEIKKRGYRNSSRRMNFWMGLTDAETEGDWRLASNGLKPTFLSWHNSEPNDDEGEDCAWFKGGLKSWYDIECTKTFNTVNDFNLYALCEFDSSTGDPSTENSATLGDLTLRSHWPNDPIHKYLPIANSS